MQRHQVFRRSTRIGLAALRISVAIYLTMAEAHAQSAPASPQVGYSTIYPGDPTHKGLASRAGPGSLDAFARGGAASEGTVRHPVACMLVRANGFSDDGRFNHRASPCPPLNARQLPLIPSTRFASRQRQHTWDGGERWGSSHEAEAVGPGVGPAET